MASFKNIQKFTRSANYRVTIRWDYMETWINQQGDVLDMNPEFQRGHVWDEAKQIAFVEYALRGGISGREVYWNQYDWNDRFEQPMFLVDGKQRVEAVRRWMNNEFGIFPLPYSAPIGHFRNEYEKTLPLDAYFNFNVNDLKTYKEVLQWYLDLNTGGVIHTDEEIEKVRKILKAETVKGSK